MDSIGKIMVLLFIGCWNSPFPVRCAQLDVFCQHEILLRHGVVTAQNLVEPADGDLDDEEDVGRKADNIIILHDGKDAVKV